MEEYYLESLKRMFDTTSTFYTIKRNITTNTTKYNYGDMIWIKNKTIKITR